MKETTLVERAEQTESMYREIHRHSITASQLARQLPLEIQELEGYAIWDGFRLSLTFYQVTNTTSLVRFFKLMGVPFRTQFSCSDWVYRGEIYLIGRTIGITLYDSETPEGCRIEESTETVTVRRAICKETGEAL